jgi:hypothetical protein
MGTDIPNNVMDITPSRAGQALDLQLCFSIEDLKAFVRATHAITSTRFHGSEPSMAMPSDFISQTIKIEPSMRHSHYGASVKSKQSGHTYNYNRPCFPGNDTNL